MRISQSLGAVVIVVGVMAFALTSCHKESSNAVTLPGATIDTSLMGQGDQTGQTGQNGQTGNTGATTDPTKWMTKAGDVVQVGIRAIELTFAAALDDQNAKIALIDGKNLDVPLARMRWAADKKSVRLFGAFPACANFTVILKAGSKNAAAETLAADESLTFTTGKNLADLDRSTMCDADVMMGGFAISGQKIIQLNHQTSSSNDAFWKWKDPLTKANSTRLRNVITPGSTAAMIGTSDYDSNTMITKQLFQIFPIQSPPTPLMQYTHSYGVLLPRAYERNLGDLNGDGIDDLVFERQLSTTGKDLEKQLFIQLSPFGVQTQPQDTFSFPSTPKLGGVGNGIPRVVDPAGDMDGDGKAEIVWELTKWQGSPKESLVASSELSVIPGNVEVSKIVDAANWKKIIMPNGYTVQSTTSGDFNGDGLSDLLIHSVQYSSDQQNPPTWSLAGGRFDLVFGASSLIDVDLNDQKNNHVKIGTALAPKAMITNVGDITGDGIADIFIQTENQPLGIHALVAGQENWTSMPNPAFIALLQNEPENAYHNLIENPRLNLLMSGLDINNDGYADLVLDGSLQDPNNPGQPQSMAYVIFGRPLTQFQQKQLFKVSDADITIIKP